MNLQDEVFKKVAAGMPGLWVETYEVAEACVLIQDLARKQQWQAAVWDSDQGLAIANIAGRALDQSNEMDKRIQDGGNVFSMPMLSTALGQLDWLQGRDRSRENPVAEEDYPSTVLIVKNIHLSMTAKVVQEIENLLNRGKAEGQHLIVVSTALKLPPELERLFTVIEHELPPRDQLLKIMEGVAVGDEEMPVGDDLDLALDAMAGMTPMEAESATALSILESGVVQPKTVWELKAQMLKKDGKLVLHRGQESFKTLGGLRGLKRFCMRGMRKENRNDPLKRPRGVLLLGVPGSGKSAFAKALGNETNRPTLLLNMGALMGSLVGQTESNTRRALQLADAMAPCILFVDEIEKGLSGAKGSGVTDSGVTSRMFGTLLTWLSDHETDVFFIGTCNNIAELPPEFSRAERFDAIFFVDIPDDEEKEAIWKIYLDVYGLCGKLSPEKALKKLDLPEDRDWTGAEIKACCRLAASHDVSLREAALNVVPVATTSKEKVDGLREWASNRCLSASVPGRYSKRVKKRVASSDGSPRRKLRRTKGGHMNN